MNALVQQAEASKRALANAEIAQENARLREAIESARTAIIEHRHGDALKLLQAATRRDRAPSNAEIPAGVA